MRRFRTVFLYFFFIYFAISSPFLPAIADEVSPPASSKEIVQLTYSFGAFVKVTAVENAASQMYLGLWAPLKVYADGTVRGEGVIRYETIRPCEWQPPHPENGSAPYCRIDRLQDGQFSIEGSVVERVHRHDEDNPIKDMLFTYADTRSKERLGYAPSKLRLKLSLKSRPGEHLSLWGFSNVNVEQRKTGGAELGLLVSNLIEKEFEITPIPTDLSITDGADLTGVNQYVFSGSYKGGTLVSGNGSAFFSLYEANQLPKATDPRIYYVHEDKSPKPRPFTAEELKAIEDYKENGYQAPSRFHELDVAEQVNHVMYGLGTENAGGTDKGTGVHLLDLTRPQN